MVDYVDITDVITGCAATLSYQEPYICKETSFSLHDSMSALELMDPKLDCCEIPANLVGSGSADTMVPPRPIPTGLDDIIADLPWDDVTLRQTACIALEALTRLEALLTGASLPESTYTCIYAHNAVLSDMRKRIDTTSTITEQLGKLMNPSDKKPKVRTTPQLVLYATTLALVEISDVVRCIVMHADIYEEEDFSVTMFGLKVFDEAQDNEASLAIRACLPKLDDDHSTEANILRNIMNFQLHFLQVCNTMTKLTSETVRTSCLQVQSCVKDGIEALKALKETQCAMTLDDAETKLLLKRCFDPYLYRPLVGNSPTRKVLYKNHEESIDILVNVFGEVACTVCHILLEGATLPQLRRLLEGTAYSSINILSRSLIVLNMYFDDRLLGQHHLWKLIGNDIQQVSGIPLNQLENKHGVAFINRMAKPVYDTLKLLLLNRNRQRTYLEAVMFPDWTALHGEAHAVDVAQRQELNLAVDMPPFYLQYVLCTTVVLMDHFVTLGIELELFQGQHDLGVAYWYRDFLLSTLLTTLSQMRQAMAKRQHTANHNGDQKQESHPSKEDQERDFAFRYVGFKRSMCRGLVRFIAALNQAEIVKNDDYEFTSHAERFRKRFDPFAGILQPPPLTYDDFKMGSDFTGVSSMDLLASTAECFKQCKNMVDDLSETLSAIDPDDINERDESLRKSRKISVGNSAFVMRLTQMVDKGSRSNSERVVFDFGENAEFCTIKIE